MPTKQAEMGQISKVSLWVEIKMSKLVSVLMEKSFQALGGNGISTRTSVGSKACAVLQRFIILGFRE